MPESDIPTEPSDRVMLISADADFAKTVRSVLVELGVGSIESCESVNAAMVRLRQEHALQDRSIGLVLLDLIEPGGDVGVFLNSVRSVELFGALPVVAFDDARTHPLIHASVGRVTEREAVRRVVSRILDFWEVAAGGVFTGSGPRPGGPAMRPRL